MQFLREDQPCELTEEETNVPGEVIQSTSKLFLRNNYPGHHGH